MMTFLRKERKRGHIIMFYIGTATEVEKNQVDYLIVIILASRHFYYWLVVRKREKVEGRKGMEGIGGG